MDVLKIVAVIAIVVFVIFRQLKGAPMRGKRQVMVPAALTVVGAVDLGRTQVHLAGIDIAFVAVSAVIAILLDLHMPAHATASPPRSTCNVTTSREAHRRGWRACGRSSSSASVRATPTTSPCRP